MFLSRLWQIRAELSMLLLPVSSKIGSKMERITTKNFALDFEVSQSSVEKHS